jgi:hypothetical protein
MRDEHFERELLSRFIYGGFLLFFLIVNVVATLFLGPRSQGKDI